MGKNLKFTFFFFILFIVIIFTIGGVKKIRIREFNEFKRNLDNQGFQYYPLNKSYFIHVFNDENTKNNLVLYIDENSEYKKIYIEYYEFFNNKIAKIKFDKIKTILNSGDFLKLKTKFEIRVIDYYFITQKYKGLYFYIYKNKNKLVILYGREKNAVEKISKILL
ncbi:hypothetical protein XO10_10255 [Marinitoga sp. 1135]|uniref:DUF4367 domain-containing protein n=1 Tax=Marinitoga piezophila (strain DSM 14283 / JCM 11233 / KA3) TaxID=443254 RepID=H2J7H4_MARPK|nr:MULTISPECIES: hypothetical protein [Marinitoga]AEX86467.1 hypothetical protein Marpi_2092 [Marinitoga piezophila KA3]APT76852.1 hypothetical protein LN42_11035 [Marinitoga sp. 1137]NUU96607.1 hypothetical protein [Marinitoga sp. 1135]